MDIENILYIIVIIVWVIVGLVKKNKGKENRPAQGMPPMGDAQQPDISEMLEELLGKKPKETTAEKRAPLRPEKETKSVSHDSAETLQTLETISHSDAVQRSVTMKSKIRHSDMQEKKQKTAVTPKITPHIVKETGTIEEPSSEPFDLRKAVIYSEILKPKFEE